MIGQDGRIYLKKFKQDLINDINSKIDRLECDIFNHGVSKMQNIICELERYVCSLYNGYDVSNLHRPRLHGDGVDIVYMILVLMNEHTTYYNGEVTKYYKRSKNAVQKAKSQHRTKDSKIPHHKVYLENFQKAESYLLNEILEKHTDERIEDQIS